MKHLLFLILGLMLSANKVFASSSVTESVLHNVNIHVTTNLACSATGHSQTLEYTRAINGSLIPPKDFGEAPFITLGEDCFQSLFVPSVRTLYITVGPYEELTKNNEAPDNSTDTINDMRAEYEIITDYLGNKRSEVFHINDPTSKTFAITVWESLMPVQFLTARWVDRPSNSAYTIPIYESPSWVHSNFNFAIKFSLNTLSGSLTEQNISNGSFTTNIKVNLLLE